MDMKTEAALVCMIVSNPTGGERPQGWQKRVNDLIRAQRDALDAADNLAAALAYQRAADTYADGEGWDYFGAAYDAILALAPADALAEVQRWKAALDSIARNTCCDGCREAALVARAALEQNKSET